MVELERIGWKNGETPINETNLKKMEENAQTAITQVNGTILYHNGTGTTGTVTLSETCENFDYLEILYENNDNLHSSVKVYQPQGKTFCLNTIFVNQVSLAMNCATAIKKIQDNSITNVYYGEATINTSGANVKNSNNIKINTVIGYK